MKSWMIWAGAAVLGVGLAAVLIPFMGVVPTTPELPELDDAAPITGQTRTNVEQVRTPTVGAATPVADPSAKPKIPPPLSGQVANNGDGVDDEGEAWVNDARYDRQQLLNRPDMVAVRSLGSRWRAMRRNIAGMDHDPAGDHTMNRIEVLQTDLRAYRRSPDGKDFGELLKRQENILSELKQTSYWNSDLQDVEAAVLETLEEYEAGNQK